MLIRLLTPPIAFIILSICVSGCGEASSVEGANGARGAESETPEVTALVERAPSSELPIVLEGVVDSDQWSLHYGEQGDHACLKLLFNDEQSSGFSDPYTASCEMRPILGDRRTEPVVPLIYRLSNAGETVVVVGIVSDGISDASVEGATGHVATGFDEEHGVFAFVFNIQTTATHVELTTDNDDAISCEVLGGQLRDLDYVCVSNG